VINGPSGKTFDSADVELLHQLVKVKFIEWRQEPFTLKSGVKSHVYVHGRDDLTLNPAVLYALGEEIVMKARAIMDEESDERCPCFIGLPTAGTALAAAASLADLDSGMVDLPAAFCVMREVKKAHGAHHQWVVGHPDPQKFRIFAVDNVATDGKTKEEGAAKFAEDGYDALNLDYLIVVDRQQGAVANLRKKGFKRVHVLYNLLDLTFIFGEVGIWPKEAVAQVEREIKEHQLIAV